MLLLERLVEMSEYLTVNEAALELNITATSIYKIVNHEDPSKQLEPVNRTTYKGDGGYRFHREEVERIKPSYVRDDLTSSQAAERIGRSKTFIQTLLKEGVIPYYEDDFRGKRTFFIKEEHLQKYELSNINSGKYDTSYDKKTGVYLFQPFIKDGVTARVVEMNRINRYKMDIVLQTGTESRFSYVEAVKDGWVPSFTIDQKKPISTYGYARFEFPIPATLDSMIYVIIEEFYKQVGPLNIRISVTEKLIVEIKKSVLSGILPTTHPDMIDKLKLFITSGEIITKFDGTLIDTGLSPITFYLPEQRKMELIEKADRAGVSLQVLLETLLTTNN